MAGVKLMVRDQSLARNALPGDRILGSESFQTVSTAGAGTLTGANMLADVLVRTGPTAGFTDTLPSAADIINAIIANTQYSGSGAQTPNGVDPGTTLRIRYLNTVAYAGTLAAGTGVTLSGSTGINASSVKDYLLRINNGTPQQVLAANTTSASSLCGGLTAAQLQLLTPGMNISGTGIPSGAKVISQNLNGNLVMNTTATATGSLVALTFNPDVTLVGLGQGTL